MISKIFNNMNKEKLTPNQEKITDSDIANLRRVGDHGLSKSEQFLHKKIKKYAREHFNGIFNKEKAFYLDDENFLLERLYYDIGVFTGGEKEWTKRGVYSPDFSKAISVYLKEMVKFLKEKENDSGVDDFLQIIEKKYFRSSPDITETLNFRQHFDFLANFLRIKKARFLINRIVGELAYKIGWHYNPYQENDELYLDYINSPVFEKLERLNLMELVGSELIAAGDVFRNGDEKLFKLLNKIRTENTNAFVGYYLDIVEENLRNNRNILAELKESSLELDKTIIPNKPLQGGEKFIQVAKDTVGIVDSANFLTELCEFDHQKAREQQDGVSVISLFDIKENLTEYEKGNGEILLDRLIDFCNKNVFIPQKKIKKQDAAALALIWAKFGNINQEDWEDYFKIISFRKKFKEELSRFKEREFEKTAEKNLQATRNIGEIYKKEIPVVVNYIKNPRLKILYEEFDQFYKIGDLEQAFHKMQLMLMILQINSDQYDFLDNKKQAHNRVATDKINLLINQFNDLMAVHRVNWDNYQKTVRAFEDYLTAREQRKISFFKKIFAKINKDKENILRDLKKEVNVIIEEKKKYKPNDNFLSLGEFIKKQEILEGSQTEGDELLFQHLYRPAMKQKIENEFGIELNNLPFYYHVYFLKFLATRDKNEAKMVKEFLNKSRNKESRKNRVKSFLSLAQDFDMGRMILFIDRELKDGSLIAEKLFSEYARIVDGVERDINELEKIYGDVFFEKKPDKEKLRQGILRKAFRLLQDALTGLKNCPEDEKKELVADLISNLKREDKIRRQVLTDLKKAAKGLDDESRRIADDLEYDDLVAALGDPEKYQTPKELNDALAKGEIVYWWGDLESDMPEKIKNFGSQTIEKIIQGIDKNIKNKQVRYNDYFSMKKRDDFASADPIDRATLSRVEKDIAAKQKTKKRLENLLQIRQSIEQTFDNFIYGDKEREVLDPVMQKYDEIVDEGRRVKAIIKEMLISEEDISEKEVDNIVDSILRRADDLLNRYIKVIKKGGTIDNDEMIRLLETQRADVVSFAAIFKEAYKKEKISFKELKNVSYKTIDSFALDVDEKRMIVKTVKLNYPLKKQQQDILEKIENSFKSKKTKWHLLFRESQDKKDLVACVRFDEIDKNNVYAATFNVGPGYRGSSLGEAMFERVMSEVAQKKKIHAITEVGKEVSDFYINKGGFNIVGIEQNEKTGIYYYQIERYDPENENYTTKRMDNVKDLLYYYEPGAQIKDLINLQKYILVKKEDKEITKNIKDINYILQNGYKTTRIIEYKKQKYFVFEKTLAENMERNKAA